MTFSPINVELSSSLRAASAQPPTPGWELLTLGVDQAASPVIVLGADGEVRHVNPAGVTALGRSRILLLQAGQLHLKRREERNLLRDAIAVGLLASSVGDEQASIVVVLHDRQNCPVMALHLRPIVGPGLPPLVSVRVADLLTPADVDPAWIVLVLGLTQAEARVAAGLFDGLNLREIAERQGLALETVRGHLKRLMVKIGSRSQAQLVRMLASSYAIIGWAGALPPASKAIRARKS